jgi:hypothetical protein
VAIQVAESCVKLYLFWESIREAPEEVGAIVEDLKYLATVMQDIARTKSNVASSVRAGLELCLKRMEV